MAAQKLTDRTLMPNPLALTDIVHIVDVDDNSQDPAGSSYKETLSAIQAFFAANLGVNYKLYKAAIIQTGTGAPALTELINTLGTTVTPARLSPGKYTLTTGSAILTANKTEVIINQPLGNMGSPGSDESVYSGIISTTLINLYSFTSAFTTAPIFSDNVIGHLLNAFSDIAIVAGFIEIRVYP